MQNAKQELNPQVKRALALVDYLINSNPRQARSLLYSAGYPTPDDPKAMRQYFMDWLSTDKKHALEKILRQHPDKGLLDAVNELDEKPATDPSFPLPNNFATPSDTYFDHLRYGQNPYTPQVLTDNAYWRPYWQQYRAGVITGFSNYGGGNDNVNLTYSNFTGSGANTKNLILVILGLIVLYGLLDR